MSDFSPVKELLDHEMIVLVDRHRQDEDTGKWDNTEIVFYLDFYLETKDLGILVYDFGKRQDHFPAARYSDYASASKALKKIFIEFPGRIDEEQMMTSVKTYFLGLKDSVASAGTIVSDGGKCKHCGGYNFDDYKFVYFPAVPGTPLDKASLELTWSYGCYREDTVEGVFEDVADEITIMLEEILEYAEKESRENIQQALDTVRSHRTR